MKLSSRQLILYHVIEVIIISVTKSVDSCITREIELQFGFKPKFIPDYYYSYKDRRLKEFSFYNLQLDWICSQAFVGMENFEILILSKNRLTHLLKNTFKPLHNIKEIDLSENQLTTISFDEFADNHQLKRLNLQFNNIHTIDHIQHQDGFSITTLLLQGNQLVDISELCRLTKLEILKLSDNINLDFKSFKSTCWRDLRYLYLQNTGLNQLKNDYNSFTGLTKLKKLYIQKNRLEVLCVGNFPELPELSNLNMADNQLQSLDANELKTKFPKLTKIGLWNNLWSCDYFKKLEPELKNLQIEILTDSTIKNCVEGSFFTGNSRNNSDSCEINKQEVTSSNWRYTIIYSDLVFVLQILLTITLCIIDIVLSVCFIKIEQSNF